MREEVKWFAKEKEKKLKENKDKKHWSKMSFKYLFHRMKDEVSELKRLLDFFDELPSECENIIKECADISNFAMFIADNAKRRRKNHENSNQT